MNKTILSALHSRLGDYNYNQIRYDGEFEFECPRCGNGKRKLGVNLEKKVFNCFRCHWSGRLSELLDEVGIKWADLRDYPEGTPNDAADSIDKRVRLPEEIPDFHPIMAKWSAKARIGEVERDAIEYCERRGGMDLKDIEDMGFGLSLDPALAGRLVMPVVMGTETVNYLARSLYPWNEPKELSGPEYQGWRGRSQIAYGVNGLANDSHIVLVEGFWDWWAVKKSTRALRPIALLGSSLSQYIAGLIASKRPNRVTIMLDGDPAGIKGTKQTIMTLDERKVKNIYVARPPLGKDPDELGDVELLRAINGARPALVWMLDQGSEEGSATPHFLTGI